MPQAFSAGRYAPSVFFGDSCPGRDGKFLALTDGSIGGEEKIYLREKCEYCEGSGEWTFQTNHVEKIEKFSLYLSRAEIAFFDRFSARYVYIVRSPLAFATISLSASIDTSSSGESMSKEIIIRLMASRRAAWV